MTSVGEIERAVTELKPEDLVAFRAWFQRFDADKFDGRIDDDARAGRLDRFADEAVDELGRGAVRSL